MAHAQRRTEAIRFWLGSSWYVHDEWPFREPDESAEVGSKFKKR
jgi:hypothetical protein